jgi:ankyrin repeat protein
MHMASMNGHIEVVKFLLTCGADVNAILSVCHWAILQLMSIHILPVVDNDRTALNIALTGHNKVVKFLLERGADVTAIGMSLHSFISLLHSQLEDIEGQ